MNQHIYLWLQLSCESKGLFINVVGGKAKEVRLCTSQTPIITTTNEDFNYNCKVFVNPFEYAPINKGDVLGFIEYYDDSGSLIATTDLCADSSVDVEIIDLEKESLIKKIFNLFR